MERLPAVVSLARSILPDEVVVQVPPNLVAENLRACLDAGAGDLGGISPQDEVNPEYAFPRAAELRRQLGGWGYSLVTRLPVYERHMGDVWPGPATAALSSWVGRPH